MQNVPLQAQIDNIFDLYLGSITLRFLDFVGRQAEDYLYKSQSSWTANEPFSVSLYAHLCGMVTGYMFRGTGGTPICVFFSTCE